MVVEEAHKLQFVQNITERMVVQEEELSNVQLVVQEILPLQILLKVLLEVMEDHVQLPMGQVQAVVLQR